METMILKTFATSMRAASLLDDLTAVKLAASLVQPKWTNKRLPPPKVEVWIKTSDEVAAKVVLDKFDATTR